MEERITWADLERLMQDVHLIAHCLLREERHAEIQTTELVDSAVRRLAPADGNWDKVTWENRQHFLRTMRKIMRRALIDHARHRNRVKGDVTEVRLEDLPWRDLPRAAEESPEMVVRLLEALTQLEERHPEWAEVVEHRAYWGLKHSETADIMGFTEIKVRRYWRRADALLHEAVFSV